jgi:hypothetical protein
MYVEGNPINFADPSGHCTGGSLWDFFFTRPLFWGGPCPGTTGTALPTPTPSTSGLTQDDIKILAVLIALESSSGVVPDDVNYMKAWALLNIRSYHQAYNRNLRPFESWKHHERPLLDELRIGGTYDAQVAELLRWYQRYSNGDVPRISAERFASIESATISAVEHWALYGSNSSVDPIHGATGFTDASGLYYPSGSIRDRHLFEIPNYISEIMTNQAEMEQFRLRAYSNSSRVYQFSIDPYTGKPAYTFTWFEPPTYPWP